MKEKYEITENDMKILENLFSHEILEAVQKETLPLTLSDNDSKHLIENGYVEEKVVEFKGKSYKFHRLTWLGHMCYCMNCKDEENNESL